MKYAFLSLMRLLTITATVVMIVYVLPPNVNFKYDYKKGMPWKYQDLYAPFSFAIYKSDRQLKEETDAIRQRAVPYYNYEDVKDKVLADMDAFTIPADSNQQVDNKAVERLKNLGKKVIESVYTYGIFKPNSLFEAHKIIALKRGNIVEEVQQTRILSIEKLDNNLSDVIQEKKLPEDKSKLFKTFLLSILKPNVSYDELFTEKTIQEQLKKISHTQGNISRDQLIVSKGQTISPEIAEILESLRRESVSSTQKQANIFSTLGYLLLVSMALIMLYLYLKNYDLHHRYVHILFLNSLIFIMVFLATLVFKLDIKYLYAVPLCILPLVVKVFFDLHVAIFVHLITVLIIAVAIPNSYEFIYLQIAGGITAVLNAVNLHKRANLFISVFYITVVYLVAYLSFHFIQEKTAQTTDFTIIGLILLNGLFTLFAQPLIYLFEKIFGLHSDLSLVELSDMNNPLLKRMANEAQGSFTHSVQVANLAEAAAIRIDANPILTRVGALYHDIGKLKNPLFFTENQSGGQNPHDDLTAQQSAEMIISHVTYGIEVGKKYSLPERIIQFIRTHHGDGYASFFYEKALDEASREDSIDESKFRYPGPLPCSKETAIVMMCDCIEAASKSIKNPSVEKIHELIERIIDKLVDEQQFRRSDITFKDIEDVKEVLKHKLTSIYNLRIAYPK